MLVIPNYIFVSLLESNIDMVLNGTPLGLLERINKKIISKKFMRLS